MTTFIGLLDDIVPMTLQTDKGLECLNRSVKSLSEGARHSSFSSYNEELMASIVERFNRTMRMWRYFTKHQTVRYIDALQDFVSGTKTRITDA